MTESDAAKNISTAQNLKEQGNVAFKEGRYTDAIVAYHQIFFYVNGYSESSGRGGGLGLPGQTTTPVSPEEMIQIRELKVAHFCNLAMCHMKHGPKYAKARDNCSKALAIDPDNVKALFRRGKCYAQLNALDEAKADLERVLQLQPDNNDAKRELRSLRGAFEKLRKKEQKKFAGMFDRIQDEEMAEAAASDAAATPSDPSSAAVPTPPPVAATGASSTFKDGVDVVSETGPLPSDLGEPLNAAAAFEPNDVHYAPDAAGRT